jgi:hypothetical protein
MVMKSYGFLRIFKVQVLLSQLQSFFSLIRLIMML